MRRLLVVFGVHGLHDYPDAARQALEFLQAALPWIAGACGLLILFAIARSTKEDWAGFGDSIRGLLAGLLWVLFLIGSLAVAALVVIAIGALFGIGFSAVT
jgi:hypothetical protein